MGKRLITILSDFGLKDPYVAEMKAVILGIYPQATVVDISHSVDKFNTRMGAFILASASPYFPKGTVHVAVVDPGVGTKRQPIVVEAKHSYYVGPDNGLLMLAALKEGIRHVYIIENPRYMLRKVSRTFHGRDVFAPAAAHLVEGCSASDFGQEITNYEVPSFAKARLDGNAISGEVLHIDDFGNIITNVSLDTLEKAAVHENEFLNAEIGRERLRLIFCFAYGDVPKEEALAIVGSYDFLEISINQGNAAGRFKVKSGDSIRLRL